MIFFSSIIDAMYLFNEIILIGVLQVNLSDFLYQNCSDLKHDLEKYVKCQPELVKSDKYNRTSPIHNVELYPKL